MYKQEEHLTLTDRVYITNKCSNLLNEEKKRLKAKGLKYSRAKIICNLIIKEYG